MTKDAGTQATLEEMLDDAADGGESGITEGLILDAVDQFFDENDDLDEQVSLLNSLRERLHDRSPFREPVENIKWVKQNCIEGNDYNPNEVAKPEMDLLYKSIKEDGYTQPIVTYEVETDTFEVVDGFHRNLVGKEHEDIRERLHGYLPVTVIDKPREDRMSSTIRHNRARGTHQIRSMSDLVAELYERGWEDERICEELGMELDEVIRLKQVSGLKEVFSGHEFSQSWTEYEERYGTERGDNDDE